MTNQQSTWNAKIQTPEYTREFTITAVAVGTTSAHAFVTRDGSQVASFDATVTVTRDRWTNRITKVVVSGDGATGSWHTVKGAVESWAGEVAFRFVRQMSH